IPHPDAVVDDASQMLHEMAVDIGRDLTDRFVDQDLDARVRRLRAAGGEMSKAAVREHSGAAGECGPQELAALDRGHARPPPMAWAFLRARARHLQRESPRIEVPFGSPDSRLTSGDAGASIRGMRAIAAGSRGPSGD